MLTLRMPTQVHFQRFRRRAVGLGLAAGLFATGTTRGATDPGLRVTPTLTSQSVILRWLGANAVPYQVEAGSTLFAWMIASLLTAFAGARCRSRHGHMNQNTESLKPL